MKYAALRRVSTACQKCALRALAIAKAQNSFAIRQLSLAC